MKVVTLLWTAIIGESSINDAIDWRGEYGDTHWPSFHTRLFDVVEIILCSLIKPTPMLFRAKIYTVML